MKVHYFNIFLFSLSLNILLLAPRAYNKRNHYITRIRKPGTRSLCECELYAPSNYDNDPEMKDIMDNFDKQTSQRFEEYNECIIKNRQKCKERWDKDIQNIILRDKIQKELTEKFATLDTNINTKDIPTCICEKSIEDKMEKTCLRCGQNMGGIVPGLGLIGGAALYSIKVWKVAAIPSAIKFATKEGIKAGIQEVIEEIMTNPFFTSIRHIELSNFIKGSNYHTVDGLAKAITTAINSTGKTCPADGTPMSQVCDGISTNSEAWLGEVAKSGTKAATAKVTTVKNATLDTIESTTTTCTTAITASLIAILIIVLIMFNIK
ncbi:PIR protein, putative [Plasmodium sp.]|nr:PIR protein, putative [Plasmodium sp.]